MDRGNARRECLVLYICVCVLHVSSVFQWTANESYPCSIAGTKHVPASKASQSYFQPLREKTEERRRREGMFCNTFVLKLSGLHLMTITMQSQEDKGKSEESGKHEVKQAPVSQLAGAP